jgi:hypothetical protein
LILTARLRANRPANTCRNQAFQDNPGGYGQSGRRFGRNQPARFGGLLGRQACRVDRRRRNVLRLLSREVQPAVDKPFRRLGPSGPKDPAAA